tara:strand:+ start:1229 stop:1582 length:354 start_codon:yes stop_codon:yes gene_type:complete
MRKKLFKSNQKFIISGKVLNRVIDTCKRFSVENIQYDKPMKALIKALMILDELEELGNLDDNELAELLDSANDLIIEGEVLDKMAQDMLDLEYDEEKSVTLNQMLKNVGLSHYNEKN